MEGITYVQLGGVQSRVLGIPMSILVGSHSILLLPLLGTLNQVSLPFLLSFEHLRRAGWVVEHEILARHSETPPADTHTENIYTC